MEEQKSSGKCVLFGSYGEGFRKNKKKAYSSRKELENE